MFLDDQNHCGCFVLEIVLLYTTTMNTTKHYLNKLKPDRLSAWFITALFTIVGFPYLKNFIVFILIKLYELFIQHGIGR